MTAPTVGPRTDRARDGLVLAEVAAVPVRAAALAGMLVGFVAGALTGSVLGALLTWLAGAVLDWQRDLAFTLGIARRLLPFGDQIGLLRSVDAMWWLVIPGVALATGLVVAVFGALLAALMAAAYNGSRRPVRVRLRLTGDPATPAAPDEQVRAR